MALPETVGEMPADSLIINRWRVHTDQRFNNTNSPGKQTIMSTETESADNLTDLPKTGKATAKRPHYDRLENANK